MSKIPKKHFHKPTVRSFSDLFREYGENCSIQGIRYVTYQNLNYMLRCFWAFAVIFSIAVCMIFIKIIYDSSLRNPIIVSYSSRMSTVSEVIFVIFNFTTSGFELSFICSYHHLQSQYVRILNTMNLCGSSVMII